MNISWQCIAANILLVIYNMNSQYIQTCSMNIHQWCCYMVPKENTNYPVHNNFDCWPCDNQSKASRINDNHWYFYSNSDYKKTENNWMMITMHNETKRNPWSLSSSYSQSKPKQMFVLFDLINVHFNHQIVHRLCEAHWGLLFIKEKVKEAITSSF